MSHASISAVSAVAVFCSSIVLAACGPAATTDPPGDPSPAEHAPDLGGLPSTSPTLDDRESTANQGGAHPSATDDQTHRPTPTGVVHVIQVSNAGFAPLSVTIALGDTVEFDFASDRQSVTSGFACLADGMFDSGTRESGQSYRVTFLRTGPFPFYSVGDCEQNTGAVLVK